MKTAAQNRFEEQRKDATDREIALETLYALNLNYRTMDKVRSNTSKLVWIVVILIFISLISSLGALMNFV